MERGESLAGLQGRALTRRRAFAALLAIALGVSLLGLAWFARQKETMRPSFQYYAPTPANLDELITARNGQPLAIVVLGRVEGVAEVGWEPTMTPEPVPTEQGPMFDQALPYSLYRVAPERVLLDDGSIAAGSPVLLYRGEHPGYPWFPELDPQEHVGERYLYFLEQYEGSYFPSRFPYSRLIVDGEVVRYSDAERSPVQFATGTPPAAFLDAVATAIATRYPDRSP